MFIFSLLQEFLCFFSETLTVVLIIYFYLPQFRNVSDFGTILGESIAKAMSKEKKGDSHSLTPLQKFNETALDTLEHGGFIWPCCFSQDRVRAVVTGAPASSDPLKDRSMSSFINGFSYLIRLMEDNSDRFRTGVVRDRQNFLYWFQNSLSMPDAAKTHCAWIFFSSYSDADSFMDAAKNDPLLWVTGLQEWSSSKTSFGGNNRGRSDRGRGNFRGGGRGGQHQGRGRGRGRGGHNFYGGDNQGGARPTPPTGRVLGFCDSVCIKGVKCGWRSRNEDCPFSHFCPLCTASKVEHVKWEDCPHHS